MKERVNHSPQIYEFLDNLSIVITVTFIGAIDGTLKRNSSIQRAFVTTLFKNLLFYEFLSKVVRRVGYFCLRSLVGSG